MTLAIVAKDVQKTYHTGTVEVHALKGINLEIERGRMVAVMGPSGCGKTTLLNCLSGLDDFDSGDILIDNVSIKRMSDRARTAHRAKHMGFIFQFYNLLPVLSAVENVELPLLIAGVRPTQARTQAREWLSRVGLEKWISHRPDELSGGQRQRVTIARALVNSPAIVWADEPTGDLDSDTTDDVMGLLKRLNHEHGQTFLIITHDPRIGTMCDETIHMRDGAIVKPSIEMLELGGTH